MSIRAKLHEIKTFVVTELEKLDKLAAEAEKVVPVVEAGAAAVAGAIPGAGPIVAAVEAGAKVVAEAIGCCGCAITQHTPDGCTGCGKCNLTAFGARNAGAPVA